MHNLKDALTLTAHKDDDGCRLDRVLRKAAPHIPLSAIHKLLRKGRCFINGKTASAGSRVQTDDIILLNEKKIAGKENHILQKITDNADKILLAQNSVLFENEHIIAINKKSGVVTHGYASLTTEVLNYLEEKIPNSLSFKPGPLHRLDKETSGVILFSKSRSGAQYISNGLQTGLFCKTYLALLCGELNNTEEWILYLNRDAQKKITQCGSGRQAKKTYTRSSPLAVYNNLTIAKVEIKTGFRHQIRAAAAAKGFPLYGDKKYGGAGSAPFMLHALQIEFPNDNPINLPSSITAPPPACWNERLKEFTSNELLSQLILQSRQEHQC